MEPRWSHIAALCTLLAWATCTTQEGAGPDNGFNIQAALLLGEEPLDPKCFTRCLEDLTCFWESSSPPSATEYGFFYVVDSPGPSVQPDGACNREPGAADGELAAAQPPLPGEQPALRGGLRPRGRRAPDGRHPRRPHRVPDPQPAGPDPLRPGRARQARRRQLQRLLECLVGAGHRGDAPRSGPPDPVAVAHPGAHRGAPGPLCPAHPPQLWLGQRNACLWWSGNPGYLEEQPSLLEVLSEGRESKAEGPVPPLPLKAQGSALPSRPQLPAEPQGDYLVLDEQLMPCSLGEDSLLLLDAWSSAGVEAPPAVGQELGPPGATPEPVPGEQVSSSSSFEYTVFDPSSELLAPCGHQRPLKYSYLLVSDSGISADYGPLGTSTNRPNLYTNLCQDGGQAQPFPASYVVCS
nr:erythropoietin receptor isoform X4 [Caretta caretta]